MCSKVTQLFLLGASFNSTKCRRRDLRAAAPGIILLCFHSAFDSAADCTVHLHAGLNDETVRERGAGSCCWQTQRGGGNAPQ